MLTVIPIGAVSLARVLRYPVMASRREVLKARDGRGYFIEILSMLTILPYCC
jgi:hypothetical protein